MIASVAAVLGHPVGRGRMTHQAAKGRGCRPKLNT